VNFLDDDDEWLPHNMEPQLAALEAQAGAGFAFGRAELATDDMVPTGITWPRLPLARGHAPEGLHVDYPQLGAVLFRRDAVAEAGCFDTRIRYHQDADLMLRIATRHPIIGLDLVGVLYRDRSPSRQRSDYYWANRAVTTWWPTGVSWHARARFSYSMRRMFVTKFLEDAATLAGMGCSSDALVCLGRAWWISPPHFLRRASEVIRTVRLCTTRSARVRSVKGGVTEPR
jgi:hypothetical protein